MAKLFIDVGGTYIRSELHTPKEVFYDTTSSRTYTIFEYIQQKMKQESSIDFIGISYAGQIHNGTILSAPNIAQNELELQNKLENMYNIKVAIENDLNCAAMAEAEFFKTDNIAVLFAGTGLGGAYIENTKLIRGDKNLAFEIGHIPYKKAPFQCGCGRMNCIELFASGSGMAQWLKYYGSECDIELAQLKNSQQEQEQSVAKEFEKAFLYAAGTLVTVTNPKLLLIGGGIVINNPYLLDMLKNNIKKFALNSSLIDLEIKMSVLKNASLQGAKLLQERKYG